MSSDPSPTEIPVARDWRGAWLRPAPLAVAAALALLGWQWIETRSRLVDIQTELARRLADADAVARESRALARQNQEMLQTAQGKIGVLEARLAETQGQQLALDAMYQDLSKTRDERLIAEIEQAVAIAAQQLQLAGNVPVALIALQGADARLARANNPRFLGVRKLLARDMETLKGLPIADVPGIALKIESVAAAIDSLPLASEQRPRTESPTKAARVAAPTEPTFWQALARDIWNDTKQLVRIERVDRPDPGLLAPQQTFFLRENLKLRLANARLALLTRDSRAFRDDMRQSREWLERYFDAQAKPTQAAQATLKSLATLDIALEPPTLAETLNALRAFKTVQDKR